MLVARLADAGDVQWDHPITETFPGADPGWTDVTLEMLLRHESGATGSSPATHPDLWTQLWEAGDTNVVATRASFAEQLLADPPTETPGNAVYSNAGFILAGAVLEAETGQAWETLVVNEVLDPLGMDDCGFGPPMEPSAEEQPWGHTVDGAGALAPVDPTSEMADNPPGIGPAGTLHCPMVDWLKFGQAHLKAASGDSSFLSTDAIGRLQTSNGSDYTAGMVYAEGQPWANGPALVMNGSNTMWFATIWIAPEIDRVFVTATNAGTTGAMMATNDAVLLAIDLDL